MIRSRISVPVAGASIAFVFHLLANPHYGFFRDELYFIICGERPAWGYVDQPPVIPLLSAASQVFGISLVALRAISALLAAAAVYVTARLAEELGGGVFAQVLAAIAVAMAPILATFGVILYPDSLEIVAWPLVTLLVVRIVRGAGQRLWLVIGATLGAAVETKYVVVFYVVAMLAGIVSVKERRILAGWWPPAGAAVAVAMALPNFLWQAHYGFPMMELLRNSQNGKDVVLGPIAFMIQQVLIMNPALSLIWIAGLVYSAFRADLRWLAIAYAALMAMMVVLHAKNYYPDAFYPMLFAAGGVAIEAGTVRWPLSRPVIAFASAILGAVFIPFAVPLLSEQQFIAYSRAVSKVIPMGSTESEHHARAALPQLFADMHGWPELAAAVARVYGNLPPSERAQAVIKTSNYGEASAINFFGRQSGLPPAISGHNQYYVWGAHGYSGEVLIDVAGDCGRAERTFRHAREAAVFHAEYAMRYETGQPIMVCTGIREPLARLWPEFRDYN